MKKRVTLSDIAEYIGISRSSVSHALSGKRPISKEVREQVQRAVRELGYSPNFVAKAMNAGRTNLIGLLVSNLNNYYTSALVEMFGEELSKHSLQMVLTVTNDLNTAEDIMQKFSSGMTDGIINALPFLRNARALQLAGSTPVVTYLRHIESPIFIDFATGIRTVLQHLIGLGHRKIALMASCLREEPGKLDPCVLSYNDYMMSYGLKPFVLNMQHDDIADGYQLAPQLFDAGVTAVLAGNDMASSGIIRWCIENKIRLPEGMSIVGLDNSPLSQMVYPPLTTLELPGAILASHTVQVLLYMMRHSMTSPGPLTIIPKMIIRESTAPLNARMESRS